MLNHTGGTSSYNGMMDYPRNLFSELNLGKFPDPHTLKFHIWKVNSEVRPRTADPQITGLWIKEVEIAKVNSRIYDIPIEFGATRFSWLRYA